MKVKQQAVSDTDTSNLLRSCGFRDGRERGRRRVSVLIPGYLCNWRGLSSCLTGQGNCE